MKIDFYKDVENITKELVNLESVVNNGSESKVSKYIYDFYKDFSYFKENPDRLILQKTKNDNIDRHNTVCLIKGNENTNKTIVMLGHIDTVGVEDFKSLKDFAFDPDSLIELLKKEDLEEDVLKDLNSGEYMVGRGSLDMKSGVAVQMAIGKYFLENLDKLNGNLVIIAECDEEDSSHGIISALDILEKWKNEENLEYELAINSDFTTSLYEGDTNKYIYLGTVGKLLPSFYIRGVEAHVGQVFSGYDPTLLGSIINKKIDLNSKFIDVKKGEATMPPVALQMRDLKEKYDVQTSMSMNLYYNFSLHGMDPRNLLDSLKILVKESFDESMEYLNSEYRKFLKLSGLEEDSLDFKISIYTWDEYRKILIKKHGDNFIRYMKNFIEKLKLDKSLSFPEFSMKIIDEAYNKFDKSKDPSVILYYGSAFYQNMEIKGIDEREKRLLDTTKEIIQYGKEEFGEKIKSKYFYPYISDASFLYSPEDDSGINAFMENFPAWNHIYSHPIEKIKKISMPVINMGVYGKDGHKFTERVYKKYSFETLPNLILEFILKTFSKN